MQVTAQLEQVAREVAVCTACVLSRTRHKTVPGEGSPSAEIMFIGEAPGYHEDRQGRPFIGPAGQFLQELLASIGLKRQDVFIANVVKCFISPRVLIYTADGYKPIKDIAIGDLVLTAQGRFRQVTYVRPRETLPAGSLVVRLTVQDDPGGAGNKRPVTVTVTPEHPFLVNGQWKGAHEIRPGDKLRMLGDRCEVCGKSYFVRYDRFEHRSYHTCSYRCHNKRIYHSDEAHEKLRKTLKEQYALGVRDKETITARANERTREMVAAGEAKIQHLSSDERRRGRLVIAQHINEGTAKHRIGFGEYELAAILDRLAVPYQHHFTLPDSTLSFDFCLPEQRILVEVRGPNFQRNQESTERALVKDRLAQEHDYLVVNFWWAQIVNSPSMVEATLRRLLQNHAGQFTYVDITVAAVECRQTQQDFPLYNIGVNEDESYIAAGMVSHNCRPPNNRDPQPDEMAACDHFLQRQIATIRPKMIVTLGRFSMAKFFPGETISKIHGQARRRDGVIYVPMYHPAAALHQPALRRFIEEDFRKIPELLAAAREEPEPPKSGPPEAQQLSLF